MNNALDYRIIRTTINQKDTLQTLGLFPLLGIELSMQLVIPESLTRGMLAQVASFCCSRLEEPSLFNDIWLQHAFEENNTLCILPFSLLKDDATCHIVVPDLAGHYPWQEQCQSPFDAQIDDELLLSNLLGKIKSFFLSHLLLDVATDVYNQIGTPITVGQYASLEELPDDLAAVNLDMYIALTVCFNQTMSAINRFIISACEAIPLQLRQMDDPAAIAAEVAFCIYDSTLKQTYIPLIMQTFHKMTQ